MKFGLNEDQYRFILQQVVQPLEKQGARVWCFGSRARGDHNPFSDLDLLVESEQALTDVVGSMQEQLEESNFPYKVDLVESRHLAQAYRTSCERDKVLFSSG